jgi:hypothetical protein
MSAIFVSHSSKDHVAAAAMQQWLQDHGHQPIFLDFDPADGIPAGVSWEQELYQRLRGCRAVIALLSENWLQSRWCFTEVMQARALGKPVFPVRVAACDSSGVLPDVQHIDLTADPTEGYRRLEQGLKRMGLEPFNWDPSRPPYPGLLAFQEQDAAIFFGREDEISDGLDALNRLRRLGGPRLILFLGASGSGKSSLVRAGLLPRLRRDADNWLPLSPFRPQGKPLDELTLALVDSFNSCSEAKDWQTIRAELRSAADAEPPDGAVLIDLTRGLQIAAGRPTATALLIIDQFEELLRSPGTEADHFLRLLRSALETGGGGLMALATMRSDFLGEFQTQQSLLDLHYEAFTVGPMSAHHLPEIIERPAEVAGIELGAGLVAAMLQDAETGDALPLLAFTLRELYERHRADRRLELEDYRQLGGLEGSVRRAADGVIAAARPAEDELEALRSAFVPAMVRLNEEGQYVRRHAVRADLPPQVQPLLQRFVDTRLLVADRDEAGQETLEVAHEALLQAWPRLHGWLEEDQDNLRLRETVRRAAEEWDQHGRDADWLVHRRRRLKNVESLIREPRFVFTDKIERDYLDACFEQRRREREMAEAVAPGAKHFRIFLASPGDVKEERSLARNVLKEINRKYATSDLDLQLDLISWDDPDYTIALDATKRPQDSIVHGMPRPAACDLVVVILWSRMGSPFKDHTGKQWLSGTEWEYYDAVNAQTRPEIWVYRRSEEPHIGLGDLKIQEKVEQYRKVRSFFERFRERDGSVIGGYNNYQGPEDFSRIFHAHLANWVNSKLGILPSRQPSVSAASFWDRAEGAVAGPTPQQGRQ